MDVQVEAASGSALGELETISSLRNEQREALCTFLDRLRWKRFSKDMAEDKPW